MLLLLLSSVILFWGGGFLFGIEWRHPGLMTVLIVCYCAFGVGFVAIIAAVMGTRKRASMLNSMAILFVGFLGGSLIPANQLPGILGDHIAPWFPNYWFAEAVKTLEFSVSGPGWAWSAGRLAVLGFLLLGGAAFVFNRLLQGSGNR